MNNNSWIDISDKVNVIEDTTLRYAMYNKATKEVRILIASTTTGVENNTIWGTVDSEYTPSSTTYSMTISCISFTSTLTSSTPWASAIALIGSTGNIYCPYPVATTAYYCRIYMNYIAQ